MLGRSFAVYNVNVRLILASQSPRRRQLVAALGYPYTSIVSGVDETERPGEDPAVYVLRLARDKATAVAAALQPAGAERVLVLAADTTVALDGRILGKPGDAAEAGTMLRVLRGRTHQVHTAQCLLEVGGLRNDAIHTAHVTMRDYSDTDIDAYIATGDPFDKAGAYAIQDEVFRPVSGLDGCYLAVMGLSLCEAVGQLVGLNVPIPASAVEIAAMHQGYDCPVLNSITRTFELPESRAGQ